MIQRIQSLLLLLTAIGFGSLFGLPLVTSDTSIPKLLADKMYNIFDHPVLIILTLAGALVSLITIFLFKKRENQLRLCYLISFLTVVLPIIAFLLIYTEGTAMVPGANIKYESGLYILIINIVLSFLSSYYIKKDQKLVSSMDRLR